MNRNTHKGMVCPFTIRLRGFGFGVSVLPQPCMYKSIQPLKNHSKINCMWLIQRWDVLDSNQ